MLHSNQLLDWHTIAMAAMAQNQVLMNPAKTMFNWSKFSALNHTNISEEANYLIDQSKLRNYFPFASLEPQTASLNPQKRKFEYLIDEIEIDENSRLSLCESSKFSDCASNVDVRSEVSSLISIDNIEDEIDRTKNGQDKTVNLEKSEKKKRKSRRNRTVFTEFQLMDLERRFDSQKYLSTPDRAELANALGLSQLQVKTWYQNRRMKWKKQVMQNGCLVAPTKPKGRPKKGTIPSLGLTFDASTLVSVMQNRNAGLVGKEIPEIGSKGDSYLNRRTSNSNDLPLVNIGNLRSVGSMISINFDGKEKPNSTVSCSQSSSHHHIQNDINQQFFNKTDDYPIKKAKLMSF